MTRRNVTRGAGETRLKILDAATQLFLHTPYDAVSLRDIAIAVGVDVAYVHRCFGSKEQLFQEVLRTVAEANRLPDAGAAELPSALVRRLFERRASMDSHGADPLNLLLRSAMSRTAGPMASERLESDFLAPLQQSFGDRTPFRATMVMSLLIGFSVLHNLLALPSASILDPGETEPLVRDALDGLIGLLGDPAAREI